MLPLTDICPTQLKQTVMVANIWGEPGYTEETLSTLRFASRVRQLTSELSLAESNDPALLAKRYERQVRHGGVVGGHNNSLASGALQSGLTPAAFSQRFCTWQLQAGLLV